MALIDETDGPQLALTGLRAMGINVQVFRSSWRQTADFAFPTEPNRGRARSPMCDQCQSVAASHASSARGVSCRGCRMFSAERRSSFLFRKHPTLSGTMIDLLPVGLIAGFVAVGAAALAA